MSKSTKQTTTIQDAVEQAKPTKARRANKAKVARIKASIPKAPEAKAEPKAKAPKAPKPKADPADLAAVHAEIRAMREAEAGRRLCLCGCGAQTPKAFFVPGHDAKLASSMLQARRQPKAA